MAVLDESDFHRLLDNVARNCPLLASLHFGLDSIEDKERDSVEDVQLLPADLRLTKACCIKHLSLSNFEGFEGDGWRQQSVDPAMLHRVFPMLQSLKLTDFWQFDLSVSEALMQLPDIEFLEYAELEDDTTYEANTVALYDLLSSQPIATSLKRLTLVGLRDFEWTEALEQAEKRCLEGRKRMRAEAIVAGEGAKWNRFLGIKWSK